MGGPEVTATQEKSATVCKHTDELFEYGGYGARANSGTRARRFNFHQRTDPRSATS